MVAPPADVPQQERTKPADEAWGLSVAVRDLDTQILRRIVGAVAPEGGSEVSGALKILAMRIAEMQEQLARIEKRLP